MKLKKIFSFAATPFLLFLSGCFASRAVLDPWGYAPASSMTIWKEKPGDRSHLSMVAMDPTLPENSEEPLTLAEVLDLSLKNNPQTQITWAEARGAAANYAGSQSADFPTLSGLGYYDRSKSPTLFKGSVDTPTVSTSFLTQWGPQLNLAYTIYDFGQAKATSETALFALYFANWTHNRAFQTVIQTVTSDYYDYLYQKALLQAYEADIKDAKTTLEAAQIGLQSGVKDVSDTIQAQTQLLQFQIQWVGQKQVIQVSYAQLLTDMGLPSDLKYKMQHLPLSLPQKKELKDVDELLTIAMDHRPDLLAARADLKSKEENVKAARLQFFPTITYDLEVEKSYFFNGSLRDDNDWNSIFSLNIPIFSGFSTLNSVRTAKSSKKQARANLKALELSVIQEITNAHSDVFVAYETIQYAQALLESAEKQYRIALSQYRVGVNTILDVLSAQTALADARAKKISSLTQWYTSLSTMSYATGIISPITPPEEEL